MRWKAVSEHTASQIRAYLHMSRRWKDLECVCGMLKMQQMKCRDSFAAECGLFTKNLYGGFKDGGEKRYKKCAPHHTMSGL